MQPLLSLHESVFWLASATQLPLLHIRHVGHTIGVPGAQEPPEHVSFSVHASPSSHALPLSLVQPSLPSHFSQNPHVAVVGEPAHVPAPSHTSLNVQSIASSQLVPTESNSHTSFTHDWHTSHTVPVHTPAEHVPDDTQPTEHESVS